MLSPTQQRGYAAESAALDFLCKQGLLPIQRNFRTRFGELDLIMQDPDARPTACLVFVEVRLRTNSRFGNGAATVTQTKQRRLLRAAKIFLAQSNPKTRAALCRFDVVSVTKPNYQWTFDWIRDAFSDYE